MSHLDWAKEIDNEAKGSSNHLDWAKEIDSEPEKPKESLPMRFLKGFNRNVGQPAGAAAGGIIEGVEHGLASIGNLGLQALGTDKRIPYTELRKYVASDPINNAFFVGGEIGGSLLPGVGVAGKVGQGLSAVDKGRKLSPLALDAISGALTGFATGAQSEDDMAGRLFGAASGAVIPTAYNLGKSTIANRIVKQQEKLGTQFRGEYEGLFNDLSKRGLDDKQLFTPRQKAYLERKVPAGAKDSLKDFIANPTFKQAHETQSDLGKILRSLDRDFLKKAKTGRQPLTSDEKNYRAIEGLRERIQDGMQTFLERNKSADLGAAYKDIGKRYASDYSPYLDSAINRYKTGDISAKKLIAELKKVTEQPYKGKNYSEIKGFSTRTKIDPLVDTVKKAAKFGGALYLGGKLLPSSSMPLVETLAEGLD